MIWAGSPYAQLIEFVTGLPVGDISYQVLANDGSILVDDTVTPVSDALSHMLMIPGTLNTCNTALLEFRTLTWNYMTLGGLVSDRVAYRVNRPLPFAVSVEGVRNKLGLAGHELTDEAVDLVSAYAEFVALIPDPTELALATLAGDRTTLLCLHAIEALAALDVLPTLQLSAAQRENGGTNEFSRFQKIDWAMLNDALRAYVLRARAALDGTFDEEGSAIIIFTTAPRAIDAITGEGT